MPASDFQKRQGSLWTQMRRIPLRFNKYELFTEHEFEELHQALVELDKELTKLKNDIYA